VVPVFDWANAAGAASARLAAIAKARRIRGAGVHLMIANLPTVVPTPGASTWKR
jgi:hypothetical protein